MPERIRQDDVARMFPYRFYDELSAVMKGFTLLNPAFLSDKLLPLDPERREALYYETKKSTGVHEQLMGTNIIDVEPFGELLLLEACCRDEDIHTFVYDKANRSQIPLSTLVVQLYDSSRQPVFSTDVLDETIRFIPEVLYDDPNLFLGAMTFTESGIEVAVFKSPPDIEASYTESVDTSDDR